MNASFESWASGDVYEHYMGRWSEQVASLFLESLHAKVNLSWLDVGCGTGALARVISSTAEPGRIVGVDLSLDFVHYASQKSLKARFVNASAISLPLCNEEFDCVVSGLALNFVPQPEEALSEFIRVVKPGGMVAAYVWDYAGQMEFLRYFWDVAVELNPDAKALHEGYRFPICQPQPLKELWQGAGLINVALHPLDAVTCFDNFDSYWQAFTLGKFPAPQYLSSLNEKSRADLRKRLQAAIPNQEDGSIQLIARAWGVFGEKSEPGLEA
jgi:SAM-dependent methyltransferase